MLQAEVKLRQDKSEWASDQIQPLAKTQEQIERIEPIARQDILKFQEKLEKIDR